MPAITLDLSDATELAETLTFRRQSSSRRPASMSHAMTRCASAVIRSCRIAPARRSPGNQVTTASIRDG
jgi:hypothetical protein